MKSLMISLLLTITLSAPLFSQGHSGSGQEKGLHTEVLFEIPDKDLLWNSLHTIAPDFPIFFAEMWQGAQNALCIRQPNVDEKYNAFSSFNEETGQFRIDFYQNYYTQSEQKRLETLLHELLHYVTRNSEAHIRAQLRPSDGTNAYDLLKQAFEDDIVITTAILLNMVGNPQPAPNMSNNLAIFLTKYPFGDNHGWGENDHRIHWDNWEVFDRYRSEIDTFLKKEIFHIGGEFNTYPNWTNYNQKRETNAHYENLFDIHRTHGIELSVDWDRPSTQIVLPNALRRKLKVQWEIKGEGDSYTISPTLRIEGSNDEVTVKITESQMASLVTEDWEQLKLLAKNFKRNPSEPLRFRLSLRNLLSDQYEQFQSDIDLLLSSVNTHWGNIPTAISDLITEKCNREREFSSISGNRRLRLYDHAYSTLVWCNWSFTTGGWIEPKKTVQIRKFFTILFGDNYHALPYEKEKYFPTLPIKVVVDREEG